MAKRHPKGNPPRGSNPYQQGKTVTKHKIIRNKRKSTR